MRKSLRRDLDPGEDLKRSRIANRRGWGAENDLRFRGDGRENGDEDTER
jgi:hypothetical protein